MADSTYRANLSAKAIPVDPLLFGRSVIMKDRDNNYAPNLSSKLDTDKDIGIPQVLYVANALPTEGGYASIGFFGSLDKCPGTPYIAFPIRSATSVATLVHTVEGGLYRLKNASDPSYAPQFILVGAYVGSITYAHVAGTTYIYVGGVGCYEYDFISGTLLPVTLTGLTPAAILGVTATGGYLLAWSEDAIAWSSLLDPTDFVPSLDTGAGGGGVEGAKGAITVCVSNSYGVYVFTKSNCVSAQLSNNARFPFNFKEIIGSSGLESVQSVSYEGNQNSAYAFTSSGFQQISHAGSKTIWTELHENGMNTPEVQEDTTFSDQIVQGRNGKVTSAKIVTIASKYVCVSMPHPTGVYFSQCWVYDLALDKWGRILIPHREVFEDESFRIGIITYDNRYVYVDSPFASSEFPREDISAYLLAGRYQHSRARLTLLLGVELENLYPSNVYDVEGNLVERDVYPEVFDMASLDGKSGSFTETSRDVSTSISYASYKLRRTGVNHSVLIKGHFNLNTILLTYTNGGAR